MDSNFVFTTEGHILPLPGRYIKKSAVAKKVRKSAVVAIQSSPSGTCQRYNPSHLRWLSVPGDLDMTSIPYQPQTDYASDIVGYTSTETIPVTSHGYCESPITASKSFSLAFGYNDYERSKTNTIMDMLGGYLVKSLSGLRVDFVGSKNDGFLVKGG